MMAVRNKFQKVINLTQILVILLVSGFFFVASPKASAADFVPRSVVISSSLPSASTTQTFKFTVPTTNSVGSMAFEYCTNSPLFYVACSAPVGLDTSAASLSSQSGNSGFGIDGGNSTANRLVLTRPAAAMNAVSTTFVFSGVSNPTAAGQTVFVRMASYASTDGTGSRTDQGVVAFATVNAFTVGAYVPPYLTFCVGVTVATDCTSATGSQVNFGEFQTSVASAATTQFSGATNDFTGYTVYINGSTMTSGNNIITALSNNSPSSPGHAQFGLNLRGNNNPVVGTDPSGFGTASPTANYNTANSFRFVDGEAIAVSPTSTDHTKFTVSYIVNVPGSQPAGFYATTMTYTAIASF